MQIFKKILCLLNLRERRLAGVLLVLIIIMALLEMIGVASIMPFIAVLTNPSLVETNFALNKDKKRVRLPPPPPTFLRKYAN